MKNSLCGVEELMPSYFWMTNESGIYLEAFWKSARDLTQPEWMVLQEPNRNKHLSRLVILLSRIEQPARSGCLGRQSRPKNI